MYIYIYYSSESKMSDKEVVEVSDSEVADEIQEVSKDVQVKTTNEETLIIDENPDDTTTADVVLMEPIDEDAVQLTVEGTDEWVSLDEVAGDVELDTEAEQIMIAVESIQGMRIHEINSCV